MHVLRPVVGSRLRSAMRPIGYVNSATIATEMSEGSSCDGFSGRVIILKKLSSFAALFVYIVEANSSLGVLVGNDTNGKNRLL